MIYIILSSLIILTCFYIIFCNRIKGIVAVISVLLMGSLVGVHYYLHHKYGLDNYYLSLFMGYYMLVLLCVFDIKNKEVPLGILIIGGCVGMLQMVLSPNINCLYQILYLLGIYGSLTILNRLCKGGIGQGDIYTIIVIGLIIDAKAAVTIFGLGLIISGIFSAIYLVLSRGTKYRRIPFIPFLLMALIIVIFV